MKKVIPLTEEDVDNNVRGVIEKICVAKCWSIGDVVVRDEEGRLVELDRVIEFSSNDTDPVRNYFR